MRNVEKDQNSTIIPFSHHISVERVENTFMSQLKRIIQDHHSICSFDFCCIFLLFRLCQLPFPNLYDKGYIFLPLAYVERREGTVVAGVCTYNYGSHVLSGGYPRDWSHVPFGRYPSDWLQVLARTGVPYSLDRLCLNRLRRGQYASCGFPREDFLAICDFNHTK